jgi:hypothetical protein
LVDRQEVKLNFGPPVALDRSRPKDLDAATASIADSLARLQMSPLIAR